MFFQADQIIKLLASFLFPLSEKILTFLGGPSRLLILSKYLCSMELLNLTLNFLIINTTNKKDLGLNQ